MPLMTLREILQGSMAQPISVQGNSVYVPAGFRPVDEWIVVDAAVRAGVIVSTNGALKVQPLGFQGTTPYDSDSLQDFSQLYYFNTGKPQP